MNQADAARSSDALGFDLWGFLLFSHGWTWLWWSVPIAAGWHAFRFPGVVFLLVGGLGVTVGGVAMSWLTYGRAGLRDLGRRVVDVRRVPGRWYLVVFLLWLGLALGGAAVAALLGGADPLGVEPLLEGLADPAGFAVSLLVLFLVGPFPEEIGWRGYWLDRLQVRWSALTASLVLGVAWAAWHAPLFLMVGYFENFDFAPEPAPFAFAIVVGSVLYTWVYNNTDRSVLAAILFHFAGNATGQLLDLSPAADGAELAVTTLVVAAVVLWWGPRDLRRDGSRPIPPDRYRPGSPGGASPAASNDPGR